MLLITSTSDPADPRLATADHLVPRYAGGKTRAGNIVAACRKCNNERNTETNRSKGGVYYTAGDDTPHSPFAILKNAKG